ncbi:MAG TPA: signal recognition particle-docking protein FtsY [Thermoplasmata archaeon]|nr:signal recognition particle-docking protein FtsY [Thermoplasmata archaeon]
MFRALKEKLNAASAAAKKRSVEDITEVVGNSGRKLKEDALNEILGGLEMELLKADVALPVAEELTRDVRAFLSGKRVDRDFRLDEGINLAFRSAVKKVLAGHKFSLEETVETKDKPIVMMFVGINGTGKTTAIAKLTYRFQKKGYSCVLAAGDTFRAGAIEQLTLHSERLGCKIIKHQAGSDPAAVAYDAVEHAKARKKDFVLIDTAGRMQTNKNLMDEMKKIRRVAKPDIVFFVGDSLAGSDAVEQARRFDEAIGIDAIILTKIDADAKGGAALSITDAIGKPVAYVSFGQEYEAFGRFDADWMIARIFGDDDAAAPSAA